MIIFSFQVKSAVKSQSNPSFSHTISLSLRHTYTDIHRHTLTHTNTHKHTHRYLSAISWGRINKRRKLRLLIDFVSWTLSATGWEQKEKRYCKLEEYCTIVNYSVLQLGPFLPTHLCKAQMCEPHWNGAILFHQHNCAQLYQCTWIEVTLNFYTVSSN